MEKDELVSMITRQVIQKLGSGPTAQAGVSGGNCSADGCPPPWDGIGTVGDMLAAGASRISAVAPLGGEMPDRTLAQMIDHTLLKAEATADEVRTLCREAAENCFMSVCVNPTWVKLAARELRGTGVKVCTVIGFPLGATPPRVKELETRVVIDDGAGEVDMVLNVGALKSGDLKLVEQDVRAVVRAARGNVLTKVILETCLLTPQEIATASAICATAGADFVKTSTGFNKGGATVEAVRIMRETVGKDMGVKASGGIRDHETALRMIGAGASRLGASASVAIVNQESGGSGY